MWWESMGKEIILIGILIVAFLSGCSQQSDNQNSSVESYVACGCGCCGEEDPIEKCLYHSKGEDINNIIEDDKKAAQSESCELVGCSLGIKYSYCD